MFFLQKRPVFIQCLLQRDLFLYNVYCKETWFYTMFIAKRPVFIDVYCKETWFYTMFIERDLFYTMFIAKRPVFNLV